MIEDLDPGQFEVFVLTTRNVYQVVDLAVTSGQQEQSLESSRFSCGEGVRENGSFSATFRQEDSVLSWQCEVKFPEAITAVKIVLPPIPDGTVVPGNRGRKKVLAEGERYEYVHPDSGNFLQAMLVEYPDRSALFIDLIEVPPRKKHLQVYKRDGRLNLSIVLEELACHRDSHFKSPVCRFQIVKSWQDAARKICGSLEKDFGVVPFEKRKDMPSWAKQISLAVNLDGMGYFREQNHDFARARERLNNLAERFPPQKTLICMEGFMGRFDHSSGSFKPEEELGGDEGFREFMQVAHELGFHIMVLGNVQAIGSELAEEHADLLKEARESSPEGDFSGYFIDWNGDGVRERVIEYVSPDNAPWRKILTDGIGSLVAKYDIDGYFLDQTFVCPNDPRHDRYRGLCALIGELRRRYPELLLAGELLADYLIPLTPFATEHAPVIEVDTYHPLEDSIFNRYTRRFMHLLMYSPDNKWGAYPRGICVRPVSMENDKSVPAEEIRNYKYDRRSFERGLLPTLMLSNWTVDLESGTVREIFEFARQYEAGRENG